MTNLDNIHINGKSAGDSLFPFLQLPVELRRSVYGYLLVFPGVLRLQNEAVKRSTIPGKVIRRSELDMLKSWGTSRHPTTKGVHRMQKWNDCLVDVIALLCTCHTVYDEAGQLFYNDNLFNFPALTGGLGLIIPRLPFLWRVKRLTVDYSYNYPEYWSMRKRHIDETMTTCIQQLADACPELKVFILQIKIKRALVELLSFARRNESSTITLVRSLKTRLERITIIAPAGSISISDRLMEPDSVSPTPDGQHLYRDWSAPWIDDYFEDREWPGLNVPREMFDPARRDCGPRFEGEPWRPDHRQGLKVWHLDGHSTEL